MRTESTEARRDRRRAYRAAGLCYCGKPPVEGKNRCERCLASARRTSRKIYLRWKAANEHPCNRCGNPTTSKLCQPCAFSMATLRHAIKTRDLDFYPDHIGGVDDALDELRSYR